MKKLYSLNIHVVLNGYILTENYTHSPDVETVWNDPLAISHKIQDVLSKALETPAPDVQPA